MLRNICFSRHLQVYSAQLPDKRSNLAYRRQKQVPDNGFCLLIVSCSNSEHIYHHLVQATNWSTPSPLNIAGQAIVIKAGAKFSPINQAGI